MDGQRTNLSSLLSICALVNRVRIHPTAEPTDGGRRAALAPRGEPSKRIPLDQRTKLGSSVGFWGPFLEAAKCWNSREYLPTKEDPTFQFFSITFLSSGTLALQHPRPWGTPGTWAPWSGGQQQPSLQVPMDLDNPMESDQLTNCPTRE